MDRICAFIPLPQGLNLILPGKVSSFPVRLVEAGRGAWGQAEPLPKGANRDLFSGSWPQVGFAMQEHEQSRDKLQQSTLQACQHWKVWKGIFYLCIYICMYNIYICIYIYMGASTNGWYPRQSCISLVSDSLCEVWECHERQKTIHTSMTKVLINFEVRVRASLSLLFSWQVEHMKRWANRMGRSLSMFEEQICCLGGSHPFF